MGTEKTEVCSGILEVLKSEHSCKSRAALLMQGAFSGMCASLQCSRVVLIGSYVVVFPEVHDTWVTTFCLSSKCD